MKTDYHVHTRWSYDGQMTAAEALEAAERAGIEELCFTEHMDYDETVGKPVDVPAYLKDMGALRPKTGNVRVKLGVEIALCDDRCELFTRTALNDQKIDFVIGSVHNTAEGDPYEPEFFAGRTKQEAYSLYIANVAERIQFSDGFHVLGHFDYVAKNAPYADRAMTYDIAPDEFDLIFRTILERGQAMELNTSAQKDLTKPLWGLDIWKRYVKLGGFCATIGSDAHVPGKIGWRYEEAEALLREAGVMYLVSYTDGVPQFRKF